MVKSYNQRLKELREDNDITQKQLAERLDIIYQVYQTYESGKRKLPIDHLITLAAIYNTSTDYILGLTNYPKPYPRAK